MAGYIGSKSSVTLVDGITKNGGTLEGDLSFGDNDKAIFGAGDDLQIYHDPSNGSIIKDNGTGRLILDSENGTGVSIMSGGIAKDMIDATKDGAVTLYHNGSSKLATTSTGVAVTGSTAHTAGDITNTISGTYNLNGANGTAGSPAYATYSFKDDPNTGMYRAAADTLTFATAGSERMRVDASGRVTKPYQPSFRATSGASNTVSADVVFTQKDFDISNSYSTSTGRFTAPLTGTYLFYLTALYTTGSTSPTWKVSWYKNGSFDAVVGEYQSTFNTTSSYHTIFNSTITMRLSSGDYVNIKNMTNKGVHISGTQTKFGGYLLG